MSHIKPLVRSCFFLALNYIAMQPAFAADESDNDALARQFITRHEATIRPLEIDYNRAWWDANTTGRDEAFQKKEQIENRLNLILANRETFKQLKAIKQKPIRDPLVAREIAVLYLQYLGRGKSLWRLSGEGRRKGADRERRAWRSPHLARLFAAASGLGSQQGRGADSPARCRQVGPLAESRSPPTGIQGLLRHAACPFRVGQGAIAEAL